MLIKLQKRTIVLSQIIGYSLALLVGVTIILTVSQLFFDIKPLLSNQTDVFKSKANIISKNISVFKSINKQKIYFSNEEIDELRNQSFVKNIAKFNSAAFKINAYSNKSDNMPVLYTDLFFESIPDEYLDIKASEWKWDPSLNFIPIIIPENYLNLYNFGFAESQGLPVLSKNTISQFEFNIQISGHKKTDDYKSKIVGFSNKINSILVPKHFLLWANKEFGRQNKIKTSRILVEFNDPSDKNILKYFNDNNYSINKEELELSKLVFFFKFAFIFVFFIAVIIIFLSVFFVLLSFNLIIQRNKDLLLNLYNIGYNYTQISKFYQLLISIITVFSILVSVIISFSIRKYYLTKIINLIDFPIGENYIIMFGTLLILILGVAYNVHIIKNIKIIVLTRAVK